MKKTDGGVLAPKGFRAGAAQAGIKAAGGLDIGVLWSDAPAVTAAIFTQSSIVAAPVVLSRQNCQDHNVRAVVVNSGNANCMTGQEGMQNAERMASDTAKLLNVHPEEVLVASTGIIGRPLPIDKVQKGIQETLGADSA
ncbi:MAG TPA: bifunctional ornithine acetyltransferase/N-acetylglutamate synthase, partial [Candidatus Saccharimonadales bacterium]